MVTNINQESEIVDGMFTLPIKSYVFIVIWCLNLATIEFIVIPGIIIGYIYNGSSKPIALYMQADISFRMIHSPRHIVT